MKYLIFIILFFFLVGSALGAGMDDLTALEAAPSEADRLLIDDSGTSKSITTLYLMKLLESSLTSFEIHSDNLDANINTIDDCATTELFVGGGAGSAPVCTTADGTGAPVRATGPTLIGPTLGVATATTLNTGQGAYELYSMNQDVENTDAVTFLSVTGDLYQDCNTAEPADYVFGQAVCADGATWNPSGTDWSAFVTAEKKHLAQKIEPAAADCVGADDPHDCCTGSGAGVGCEETWQVIRDTLGNQYVSGYEKPTYGDANNYTIAASEAYGYTFFATGAGDWMMPPVASGMNLRLENHTASDVNIYPSGSEQIKLNGASALTAGYGIVGTDTGDVAECVYYASGVWSCFATGYESTGAGGGGESCPAYYADANVTFSWDGDHDDGTDYGCRAAGTTIQASGSLAPHTDYGEGGSYGVDLDGSNGLVFAVSGDTEIDNEIGTIWLRVKMVAEAGSVTMIEAYGDSLENSFGILKAGSDPDVQGLWELDGTGVDAYGNQVPAGAFTDVAYAWDRANGDHAGWGNDGTGWEDDNDEIAAMTLADISELVIGEKNYTAQVAPTTYLYIDQIAVLSTYKAGKPANW